ncbi:MAG: prepilin-type N-terminal cleavage/methylation domain-containing protein, partial [Planctomycetota bacterium]|nr:prepilin-type N-terminal cleavage/methylation domain-containing protein [Planctomycetota bacterium]
MRCARERGVSLLEILIATAILSILMIAAFHFTRATAEGINFESQVIALEQDANRVIGILAHSLRSARLTPGMSEGANADLIAKGYPPLDGVEDLGNTVDLGGGVTRATQAGQVCFQVPVDHDEDGDTTDASLNTEWGAKREDISPTDYKDAYIVYRFRGVDIFDEAAKKYDLNRDGDTTDVFDVGHIETVYTAGGTHLG